MSLNWHAVRRSSIRSLRRRRMVSSCYRIRTVQCACTFDPSKVCAASNWSACGRSVGRWVDRSSGLCQRTIKPTRCTDARSQSFSSEAAHSSFYLVPFCCMLVAPPRRLPRARRSVGGTLRNCAAAPEKTVKFYSERWRERWTDHAVRWRLAGSEWLINDVAAYYGGPWWLYA